ncbi:MULTISPECIES: multidrug effflux MFS transporter [Vibrio]|uniref:MFS transporter n=1 Tax=Vibrio mediterranei TaxID=689 RepID=A0ABX5DAW2_9VIBR|nr:MULTISPECIES: multidrug effflux MFS transporter [Vibrio]MDC5851676.1 multidrug effflux MFS transporter [Vibrio europaeus]PCD88519.1 MFS transporter [Vibrio mediterranei]PRQ66615.1 MFS transporter [Vibrio mediterranei]PTC06552.1 MFS transporter [Vibrio mediterranei]SBO07922.1 Multidrug resistance protein MdtL [Vibrio mediterranei]
MAGNKFFQLLVIFSLIPLGPLAIDVYLPSFPQMIEAFAVSESEIRQTISIYVLALGVSQLIAGPVSDRKGRKFSAMLGLIMYAAGSLLVVASSSLEMLYAARALQGVGASFTMITAMAWVRDNYEGDVAGKWLSYMGGVTSAVPTIAPLIGSGLALLWGWTGGFYLMAGLALLLFIMSAIALQSKKSVKATVNVKDTQALKCNVRDILTNRTFLVYSLTNMLSFGALLTYISVAPIVAISEGGFSQVQFSLMFGMIGGVQILASLIAPRLMRSFGRRNTVRFGATVITVGGMGLLFISSNATYLFFALSALGAAGFSLLSGSATSLALEPFKYCAGLATSIDGFFRMIGGALLVAVSGLLGVSSISTLAIVMLLSLASVLLVTVDNQIVQRTNSRLGSHLN